MTTQDIKRLAQSYFQWAGEQIEAHPTADVSFEAYLRAILQEGKLQ